MGSAISAMVHLGILLLIIAPFAVPGVIIPIEQGAGGPGPAGGGGGGNRGSGPRAEALRYVTVAPPPAPAPTPTPIPPTPVKIDVQPPKPDPLPPIVQPELPALKAPLVAVTGTGGTGSDGTTGTGPGSGGGVGTGVGTGRGSSVGPGTGGGNQRNYPPTPTEMLLPPQPVPSSVKGHHLIAQFDVDETGRVLSVTFNETRDRGYNRRLMAVLKGYRFRPGTTPDGKAIRMIAQVELDLY